MKMKKYLRKKNQLRYKKFLIYLKIYICIKNMVEENISQEVKLKNTDETKEYFSEEIDQNRLTSRKHEKVCTTQNYIQFFLI